MPSTILHTYKKHLALRELYEVGTSIYPLLSKSIQFLSSVSKFDGQKNCIIFTYL